MARVFHVCHGTACIFLLRGASPRTSTIPSESTSISEGRQALQADRTIDGISNSLLQFELDHWSLDAYMASAKQRSRAITTLQAQ